MLSIRNNRQKSFWKSQTVCIFIDMKIPTLFKSISMPIPFMCNIFFYFHLRLGGNIRLYTEKFKSQPIVAILEDNPLPIQYISFASFENSETQFFYNCSHIDTSVKSIMGWFNMLKYIQKTKSVIVWQANKTFICTTFWQ